MKHQIKLLTSASAVTLLALTVFAEDAATPKGAAEKATQSAPAYTFRAERLGRAAKASSVIGMEVKSYQGETLGKVQDLSVDLETGRIVQVILSSGGFLGIGDSLVAVPPGALHCDLKEKVIHLNADKETLRGAPRFDMARWAAQSESNHVAGVYRYFNEDPSSTFSSVPTVSANESSRVMVPQKASKVMGMSVKTLQDEKLGEVDDLVVDLSAGRIVTVIIASGGFLGMGDELSAVPPAALRYNAERDALHLDTTKDALSNAPHFKAKQWPELGDPSYSESVYRAYRVEPYFTTNGIGTTAAVANPRWGNNHRALTALDQGNSSTDRDRSAEIRREILAGVGMSVNAKNVKIITIDGQVTLRGPVNTVEEKRLIGAIADRIARSENVNNQLVVGITTSSNN